MPNEKASIVERSYEECGRESAKAVLDDLIRRKHQEQIQLDILRKHILWDTLNELEEEALWRYFSNTRNRR